MMFTNQFQRLGACLLLAVACGKEEDAGESGSSGAVESGSSGDATSMASGTTEADCTPGYESCACVGGEVCLAGLSCVSKVCVDLGELSTSEAPGASDATGKDSSDEPPPPTGACSVSADCADTEVCVEGLCGDTDAFYFDVRVTWFAPDDCSDGWGSAEVYFAYFVREELQAVSPGASCPANWSGLDLPLYDSLQPFQLDFWEDDEFEDDHMATLCWNADGVTGFGPCSVVPKYWLHEGSVTGFLGPNSEYSVTVTFTPA